jgi:hypothetical protein
LLRRWCFPTGYSRSGAGEELLAELANAVKEELGANDFRGLQAAPTALTRELATKVVLNLLMREDGQWAASKKLVRHVGKAKVAEALNDRLEELSSDRAARLFDPEGPTEAAAPFHFQKLQLVIGRHGESHAHGRLAPGAAVAPGDERLLDIEERDLLSRDRRSLVFVTGSPGAGKSTWTRHISSLRCRPSEQQPGWMRDAEAVMLLRLRDLRGAESERGQVTIADLVRDACGVREPSAATLEWLQGRRVLWILDGYDELNLELTSAIAALRSLCRRVDGPSIILTSRPDMQPAWFGARDSEEVDVKKVRIAGLGPSEQEAFSKEYFQAVDGSTYPEATLESFQPVLVNEQLNDARKSPLMLKMMCYVQMRDGCAGEGVTNVFEKAVEKLRVRGSM